MRTNGWDKVEISQEGPSSKWTPDFRFVDYRYAEPEVLEHGNPGGQDPEPSPQILAERDLERLRVIIGGSTSR